MSLLSTLLRLKQSLCFHTRGIPRDYVARTERLRCLLFEPHRATDVSVIRAAHLSSMHSYTGLPQRLPQSGLPDMYYAKTGHTRGSLDDRTRAEMQRFTFALFEMNRLYSYRECRVIVLPQVCFGRSDWTQAIRRGWVNARHAPLDVPCSHAVLVSA